MLRSASLLRCVGPSRCTRALHQPYVSYTRSINDSFTNLARKRFFSSESKQSWLDRFLGPKPMPDRYTKQWFFEITLICTVFAITGSSTMILVRPAVNKGLGLNGSFKDGPWSYRICTLVVMSPLYSVLLVCVGTVFGRHFYFKHFSVKMLSRFGIPPEALDANYHVIAKNFRKW
jgi:hypothetical protein